MTKAKFALEMSVRDYECDIQRIVNNGVYHNYLEHARHKYLKEIGIDFSELARAGTNLVVVRAEIDYKHPLASGDRFVVEVRMERESKFKFAFLQDIYRLPDRQHVISARIIGTALNSRGRPEIPPELEKLLD